MHRSIDDNPSTTSSTMRLARLTAGAVTLALLAGCAAPGVSRSPATSDSASPSGPSESADEDFTALESAFDARLGVFAVDTGSGAVVEWRADERFAYASTFKALAAAALVDEVGISGLSERITFGADDLVTYSPVTEQFVGEGMTLMEVADAAVRYSDNTAGNILLDTLGGPAGFDAQLAAVGDDVTNSSRTETSLNEGVPGDDRDTSTPRALATTLREYTLGDTLNVEEEALVTGWLIGTTTGDALIRANLPADWVVGDKSGAGGHGTRNDIGIIFPPNSEPIVIAVLSTRGDRDAEYDDALIADAAAVAVSALGF
ncbi:MAG: Beta-lactamase 1 precursor [Actinomycetota bacterium]